MLVALADTETEVGTVVGELAVAVSETRAPVKEYAAAQAARPSPFGQHHVFPLESWVQ
jgi:hypothetical protein